VLYRVLIVLTSNIIASSAFSAGVWDKSIADLPQNQKITVYRSPTCSCCGLWLEHLTKNGFEVNDIKTTDMQTVKQKYGVNGELASCHTAVVEGYVVEGHVPAADIRKLLQEKPSVIGISVPKMPHGTPGMEMSGRKEPFSVVSFDKDGESQSFTDYLFY